MRLVRKWLGERLFDSEISARPADEIPRRATFDEFEAVTEGAALAHQSENFDFPRGQGEFQAHHFVEIDLLPQHGGDSRLADIDGVSASHRAIARVDANVDFQLEAGSSAGLDKFTSRPALEWLSKSQDAVSDRRVRASRPIVPAGYTAIRNAAWDSCLRYRRQRATALDRHFRIVEGWIAGASVALLVGFAQAFRLKQALIHAVQALLLDLR